MDVDVTPEGVLVYASRDDGGERVQVEVHLAADGAVERTVRRQLALSEETRYTWREVAHGLVLERRVRLDPVRPTDEVIHEVAWSGTDAAPWPERVVLRMPGKLPQDIHYVFRVADAASAAGPAGTTPAGSAGRR